MSNRIRISFDRKHPTNLGLGMHLRKCINTALKFQGMDVDVEINVLVTDNRGIRAINSASRNIDQPTDVLSFPMFSLTPGVLPEDWGPYLDPETGRVPLGNGPWSRRRSTAMELSVKPVIWRFTLCSICWVTTIWMKVL